MNGRRVLFWATKKVPVDGKVTVPLEVNGMPEFRYERDTNGNPVVRFFNWRNNWVEYPDIEDVLAPHV